jgi:hypothetical protein
MELQVARVDGRLGAEPRVALRVLAISIAVACAAGAALLVLAPARAPRALPSAALRGPLATLPLASQGPVSASLGAHERAYAIESGRGGLLARNPRQRLQATIDAAGVHVRAGATAAGLSLRAVGWGRALDRLPAGSVLRARGNVATVAHSGVAESFTNGPLGLEQSFSIAAAPAGVSGGPLTLELALSSNRPVRVSEGGHGLAFAAAGATALRWSGLLTVDAAGRRLASSLALSGDTVLVRVDTRGARFPVTIDPFFQEGGKLTGSEESGAGEAGVGVAVSADGNTAIVGAPADNGGVGAAFVFVRSGSTWEQQGPKLTATGETGNGRFGFGVALSHDGNTAVIGAPLDSSGVGAAWVFTREGSTWTQTTELTGGSEESGKGEFGIHVALSADASTALVGASADKAGVGAAWVFAFSEGTWTQQGPKLTGSGEVGLGRFGFSVALSEEGTTALLGGGSDNEGAGAGWVFTREGTSWVQQGAKLTGSGESGHGHLGYSAALSADGNTALVGAIADNSEVGAAWVFVRSAGAWEQQGAKLTGAGESGEGLFGASVALSADGSTAVIGGPADALHVGALWPFVRTGTTWTGQSKLTATEESGKGELGVGVSLSGDGHTAFAGGPGDAALTGAAWVFADVPLPPAVVTQPASSVFGYSAVLNGTVNPEGQTVSECRFEYGTSTEYGKSVPCSTSPGSGTSAVAVSAAVSGLQANTTYHYRLVAVNPVGTGDGADELLTTANPPELGRCVKLAKGVHGGFATATCTTAATVKNFAYEWEPGPGPNAHFTAVIKPTTVAVLETTKKRTVTCTGAHAVGEYTGRRTLGGVVITLTGCESAGAKCTSAGAGEGEGVTTQLEGQLGIERTSPEGPQKNKAALDLAPAEPSGPVAEFTCGPTAVVIRGSVLAPLAANKMVLTDTLKYTATGGKQKPEAFEGMPADVLLSTFGEAAPEQTGLKLQLIRTDEEKIEVNTVV